MRQRAAAGVPVQHPPRPARDPATGEFVVLGKTFGESPEAMLAEQTQAFSARERARDDMTVYLRPEIVDEIAFDGVQSGPRYRGGVALRFARELRDRPDESAHGEAHGS